MKKWNVRKIPFPRPIAGCHENTVLLKCFSLTMSQSCAFEFCHFAAFLFQSFFPPTAMNNVSMTMDVSSSKQPTKWNLSTKLLQQKTSDKVSDQVTIKHIGTAMTCQVFLSCPGQEWVVVGLHAWFFGGSFFFLIDRLNPRRILCKQRLDLRAQPLPGWPGTQSQFTGHWWWFAWFDFWELVDLTHMRLSSADVSSQPYRWAAHPNRWNVSWGENRCRQLVFSCVLGCKMRTHQVGSTRTAEMGAVRFVAALIFSWLLKCFCCCSLKGLFTGKTPFFSTWRFFPPEVLNIAWFGSFSCLDATIALWSWLGSNLPLDLARFTMCFKKDSFEVRGPHPRN